MSSLNQPPAAHETSDRNCSAAPRIVSVWQDFAPQHHQILGCDRRFIVRAAGRRWGKTTLRLFKLLCHGASVCSQHVGVPVGVARLCGAVGTTISVPPVSFQRNLTLSCAIGIRAEVLNEPR